MKWPVLECVGCAKLYTEAPPLKVSLFGIWFTISVSLWQMFIHILHTFGRCQEQTNLLKLLITYVGQFNETPWYSSEFRNSLSCLPIHLKLMSLHYANCLYSLKFVFVNSAFSPGPDETVIDLYNVSWYWLISSIYVQVVFVYCFH